MTTRPAKAFLSHSSEDKQVSSKLATHLMTNGVDVWYDKWEIKPGDSLRRKIDDGIEGASYFLVLLTPASLQSEWVQTELDAGMVRRIEGKCRLIPVILDVSHEQVPITLRGLRWVSLNPYDEGLRELINVCHEVDTKPALGSAPAWTKSTLTSDIALSVQARRLATLLSERSVNGDTLDPMLDAADILKELQITEKEASDAADELDELGWVKLHLDVNMGNVGFGRISPELQLFFNIDPHVKGWKSEEDAYQLAVALVNAGEEMVSLQKADELLKWGPRRINPAAHYLESNGLAKARAAMSSQPYAFEYFQITPRTRRFATR